MNFKKLLLPIFFLLFSIFPLNVLAYSNYLIHGGDNIGLKVNTKYVTIQGFYKVNDEYIGSLAGFKVGDKIVKVNEYEVTSIKDMIKALDKSLINETVNITFIRNNKTKNTSLKLYKDDNGIYKTGLYVKDSVTGIGTLTYIDPDTLEFASLGHMIQDKNSGLKVEIKDGEIFSSIVTGIERSIDGEPGEKKAKFSSNDVNGIILENKEEGIFGKYTGEINSDEVLEISNINDIKLGKAYIRTVVDGNNKEDFEINILNIDKKDNTKNLLFEVTDPNLLELTGGIVAGMSGSPIIQDNKLIGAVTHVVINDTKKGYGISIKNMLERK